MKTYKITDLNECVVLNRTVELPEPTVDHALHALKWIGLLPIEMEPQDVYNDDEQPGVVSLRARITKQWLYALTPLKQS